MRKIDFSPAHAKPIRLFDSVSVSEVGIGRGDGETHVYCLHFEPHGKIGEHQAGFDQLFLVVQGRGWASGADGRRVELSAGQGVYFERGELHSKGSDIGMMAIMVQATSIEPNESTIPH